MCVICKQARKTGRAWAGMGAGAQAPAPAVWVPAHSSKAASRKAQQPRFGKGAYVRAVPQIAGGPFVSQVGGQQQQQAHCLGVLHCLRVWLHSMQALRPHPCCHGASPPNLRCCLAVGHCAGEQAVDRRCLGCPAGP